jgi:hypothetical protein
VIKVAPEELTFDMLIPGGPEITQELILENNLSDPVDIVR